MQHEHTKTFSNGGSTNIEQQVMGSVATIYTWRRVTNATALKVYALVASVYALGALVWVARIQENFFAALEGGVGRVLEYLLVAVTNTEVTVQAVLLVAIVVLFSLAVDLARSVSPDPQPTF